MGDTVTTNPRLLRTIAALEARIEADAQHAARVAEQERLVAHDRAASWHAVMVAAIQQDMVQRVGLLPEDYTIEVYDFCDAAGDWWGGAHNAHAQWEAGLIPVAVDFDVDVGLNDVIRYTIGPRRPGESSGSSLLDEAQIESVELEPFVESLELSRLVLHDDVPANAESWFIARVFEHAAARGVRGIVSFSDPVPRTVDDQVVMPGHVGTIYQASNATYAGRGTARSLILLPNGQVLNNRSMQKVRGQERGHEHVEKMLVGFGARAMRAGERPTPWLHEAIASVGATRLRHRGNHRYLFTVGTRSQRRAVTVNATPLPYPKDIDQA